MNLHTFHQIFTNIHQYSPIFTNIPYAPWKCGSIRVYAPAFSGSVWVYAPANLLAAQNFLVFKTQNSPVCWLLPTRNNSQHSPCLSVISSSHHCRSLSHHADRFRQTILTFHLVNSFVFDKNIYICRFGLGKGAGEQVYNTLLVVRGWIAGRNKVTMFI